MQMDHERMDVYALALEVAQWTVRQQFPRGLSDLRNQTIRASWSVVLNVAEGLRRRGKARENHLEIARGSAAETLAALSIVPLGGVEIQANKLRRIDRMLERLGG